MTKAEWNACSDPIVMIELLRGNPTTEENLMWRNSDWQFQEPVKGKDRRFRLFACACCRRIWNDIPQQCNRDVVIAVEDFLEERNSGLALQAAISASSAVEWKEGGSGRRQ